MRISKLAVAIPIAFLGLVLPSTGSSATTAGWMIAGKTLTAAESAALATTAKTDRPFALEGFGLSIECSGTLEVVKPEIKDDEEAETSAVFTQCRTSNANCEISTAIGTVPLTTSLTLDAFNSLAVSGVIRPRSGTTFTTIKFSGEKCAVAGVKPVTGALEALGPTGQDERTLQLAVVNQAASGTLKLASSAATLTGAALESLASHQTWSFL